MLHFLFQKYDSDPAAKEAAARVLASKLGADAGLAFKLEPLNMTDENMHASPGKNHKLESFDKTGLRRRTSLQRASSSEQSLLPPGQERNGIGRMGNADSSEQSMEIEPFPGKMSNASGGWVARLAAMLVGEDPTQCYALICKNCHMHNGVYTSISLSSVNNSKRYIVAFLTLLECIFFQGWQEKKIFSISLIIVPIAIP
mgnify:CR=1 FL=1